jgi:two-component system NtrC family sensor kinase
VRLGVSAKIFLAYAVILVAFAASSILSVVYLHRGRQEMAADRHRRAIQSAVDDARRALAEYSLAPATPGNQPGAVISRVVAIHGIPSTLEHLQRGQNEVESYLRDEAPDARQRQEFEAYRRELAGLAKRLDELGARRSAEDALTLPYLIDDFRKLGDGLRTGSARSAQHIVAVEQRAVDAALLLGGVGLLFAFGAALFMLRTLRPLRVLRMQARQIAGGDYGRRMVVPSRDEIGDLAREFDAMGRAIEEREHRLIRSERLATVGRMAAQITHEIRNPLASLGLYVELLGDELSEDVEARRLVASIGNEIDRLSEITETYLRFVRLPRPKLEREDLGAVATAVMEFARAELSKGGISLELSVAAGLPEVAADENQIRQALLNLVRNAREAMPSGGKLRVEVGPGGAGQVRMSIADTGSGIPAEHLGNIFEPFFSTKEKGTGLGLALVQQILAEHGGRIEVGSAPGGGTVFTLTLPTLPPEVRLVKPAALLDDELIDSPLATAKLH